MIFFASCSLNFQDLVLNETLACGVQNARSVMGGVEFEADFWSAVRYCLTSRLSSRVMMRIAEKGGINSAERLKEATQNIHFEDYFDNNSSILVTATIHKSDFLKNSMFACQMIKDGICDRQRELFGSRSYVDKDEPKFVIHLHIEKDKAQWYLDFSGQSLCKRGYRKAQTPVYLQEHTSYAVLSRSGYFKGSEVKQLIDPFCGSGTILIEAALHLANVAPGLINTGRYKFLNYPEFDNEKYGSMLQELTMRAEEGKAKLRHEIAENGTLLFGFDSDKKALEAAMTNAEAAGVSEFITFQKQDIRDLKSAFIPASKSGFIVTDPPYGERVSVKGLELIYKAFGDFIREHLQGWNVSVLTGQSELLTFIDLHPERTNTIMNGPLKCTLAHYYILSPEEKEKLAENQRKRDEELLTAPLSKESQMVFNRLEKNYKSLQKFLNENNITCYRLYDRDIQEYNVSVDIYEGKYAVIYEYEGSKNISAASASKHLSEFKSALIKFTQILPENIHIKTRKHQRGSEQYTKEKLTRSQNYIINEGGLKFYANFTDYLDTWIFLDHRPIRSRIKATSEGKRFLNLFAYTGTATAYAMAGGALSSVSVDTSAKYQEVTSDNLRLNRLDLSRCILRKSDVFEYLKSLGSSDKFDLIFLDPPTFSNSKSRNTFDVQKDHTNLIKLCMHHLEDDGELIFSNNFSAFKMDEFVLKTYDVEDISAATIDPDFKGKFVHNTFLIHHKHKQLRTIKDIAVEINSFHHKVFER